MSVVAFHFCPTDNPIEQRLQEAGIDFRWNSLVRIEVSSVVPLWQEVVTVGEATIDSDLLDWRTKEEIKSLFCLRLNQPTYEFNNSTMLMCPIFFYIASASFRYMYWKECLCVSQFVSWVNLEITDLFRPRVPRLFASVTQQTREVSSWSHGLSAELLNHSKRVQTPVVLLYSLSDKYRREKHELFYHPSLGLESTTTIPLEGWIWHWITFEG